MEHPSVKYGHCGSCSAPDAPLKCPCQATHYCDKECQRDDKNAHRGGCSYFLRKDIDRLCRQLQMLKAQHNCSACEVAVKEEKLASLHHVVGDLWRLTLLPSNYPLAEDHLKQGLEISSRMEADYLFFSQSSDEGNFVEISIGMLNNLGLLYSQWDKKGAALEAYEHARDCLRTTMMGAHPGTNRHSPTFSPHRVIFITDNTTAKGTGQTSKSAMLNKHKHSGKRRLPFIAPSMRRRTGVQFCPMIS